MQEALVEARTDEPQQSRTPRKAAVSAWIGSALEYYQGPGVVPLWCEMPGLG